MATTLVVSQGFLSLETIQAQDSSCIPDDISVWPAYSYLDEAELKKFKEKIPTYCHFVNNTTSVPKPVMLFVIQGLVLKRALCTSDDGGHVQSEHKIPLDDLEGSVYESTTEQLNESADRFCQTPKKFNEIYKNYQKYLEETDATRKEFFCIFAENVLTAGEPGLGRALANYIGLNDVPSLRALREKGKELCISLKLGEKTLPEARIIFDTELRFAFKQIAKEQMYSNMEALKPLNSIFEKIIGKAIDLY